MITNTIFSHDVIMTPVVYDAATHVFRSLPSQEELLTWPEHPERIKAFQEQFSDDSWDMGPSIYVLACTGAGRSDDAPQYLFVNPTSGRIIQVRLSTYAPSITWVHINFGAQGSKSAAMEVLRYIRNTITNKPEYREQQWDGHAHAYRPEHVKGLTIEALNEFTGRFFYPHLDDLYLDIRPRPEVREEEEVLHYFHSTSDGASEFEALLKERNALTEEEEENDPGASQYMFDLYVKHIDEELMPVLFAKSFIEWDSTSGKWSIAVSHSTSFSIKYNGHFIWQEENAEWEDKISEDEKTLYLPNFSLAGIQYIFSYYERSGENDLTHLIVTAETVTNPDGDDIDLKLVSKVAQSYNKETHEFTPTFPVSYSRSGERREA